MDEPKDAGAPREDAASSGGVAGQGGAGGEALGGAGGEAGEAGQSGSGGAGGADEGEGGAGGAADASSPDKGGGCSYAARMPVPGGLALGVLLGLAAACCRRAGRGRRKRA